jgi:hypothetical protein
MMSLTLAPPVGACANVAPSEGQLGIFGTTAGRGFGRSEQGLVHLHIALGHALGGEAFLEDLAATATIDALDGSRRSLSSSAFSG